MYDPVSNFEMGKTQHQEYEAQAGNYAGYGERPNVSKLYKLALILSVSGLSLLIIQLIAG